MIEFIVGVFVGYSAKLWLTKTISNNTKSNGTQSNYSPEQLTQKDYKTWGVGHSDTPKIKHDCPICGKHVTNPQGLKMHLKVHKFT